MTNKNLRLIEEISLVQSNVEFLSHQDAKVLSQFETFANNLLEIYSNGEGFIAEDIHRILSAVNFSAEKHKNQKRKNSEGTPYIIHPIGVADQLLMIGNVRNADIIIGALLHDTVEDTDTSFEEVQATFGTTVEGYVREVTDDKSLPKARRKELQILNAPRKSAGAAQIKLSDKLYNLKDMGTNPPGDWPKERVDEYFIWASKVVKALPWVNANLLNEVLRVIDEYQHDRM